MPDTQLLCTFTYQSRVENTIAEVVDNYEVSQNRVFVLQNLREPEELFCTYNIEKGEYSSYLDKTISIHRKRETNTLYTINALNQLIIHLNGELDKSFPIPWKEYKDGTVTVQVEGGPPGSSISEMQRFIDEEISYNEDPTKAIDFVSAFQVLAGR